MNDENQKKLEACLVKAKTVHAEDARTYGEIAGGIVGALVGIPAGVLAEAAAPVTVVLGAIGGGVAGAQLQDHDKVRNGAVGAFLGAGAGTVAPGIATAGGIIGAGAKIGGQIFAELRQSNEEEDCYDKAKSAQLSSPKTPVQKTVEAGRDAQPVSKR